MCVEKYDVHIDKTLLCEVDFAHNCIDVQCPTRNGEINISTISFGIQNRSVGKGFLFRESESIGREKIASVLRRCFGKLCVMEEGAPIEFDFTAFDWNVHIVQTMRGDERAAIKWASRSGLCD